MVRVADQRLAQVEKYAALADDDDAAVTIDDVERVGIGAACVKFCDRCAERGDALSGALLDRVAALGILMTPNERARQPVHRYEFRVASRPDAAPLRIALSERRLAASELGSFLYMSSLLLASMFAHHVELLHDARVVELGAGRALAALAAAAAVKSSARPMRALVVTDGEDVVLQNIEQSIASNANVVDKTLVSAAKYAFGSEWMHGDRADLLFGADVCYEDPHPPLVAASVDAILAPDGLALIVCAIRYPSLWTQLIDELHQRQFQVVVAELDVELSEFGRSWQCGARIESSVSDADATQLRIEVEALLSDAPAWIDEACRAPGRDMIRLMSCGTFYGSDFHEGGIRLLATRRRN